jgi:hypothetical protein
MTGAGGLLKEGNVMAELEYAYVKGHGWIPREFESVTLENMRLEARVPNEGELFSCAWGGRWILSPKIPNLMAWAEVPPVIAHLSLFSKQEFERMESKHPEVAWITVIPLREI